MTKQTIPVASMKDFLSDSVSARQNFIDTVGKALADVGFFALEEHGVDSALIDKAYGAACKFFELSDQQKLNYEMGNAGQRGFTCFGSEHAKDHDAPDLKEFWHVGREFDSDHPLYHVYPKNVWPGEVSQFKEIFTQLYSRLDTCAERILKACAIYLGEEVNLFSDMVKDGNTILRVIHYPPLPEDRDPSSVRAAAHEDINLITLLCESTDEGLELLQRNGEWLPIHALSGQIIVDTGDMIQNLTNGVLKSTTHRVVNPNNDKSRRFSMPFFVHPRSDVSLNPLQSCVERVGEKKFPDITAGVYLEQRLKEIGLRK